MVDLEESSGQKYQHSRRRVRPCRPDRKLLAHQQLGKNGHSRKPIITSELEMVNSDVTVGFHSEDIAHSRYRTSIPQSQNSVSITKQNFPQDTGGIEISQVCRNINIMAPC